MSAARPERPGSARRLTSWLILAALFAIPVAAEALRYAALPARAAYRFVCG